MKVNIHDRFHLLPSSILEHFNEGTIVIFLNIVFVLSLLCVLGVPSNGYEVHLATQTNANIRKRTSYYGGHAHQLYNQSTSYNGIWCQQRHQREQ
jgi:hypothetical protein